MEEVLESNIQQIISGTLKNFNYFNRYYKVVYHNGDSKDIYYFLDKNTDEKIKTILLNIQIGEISRLSELNDDDMAFFRNRGGFDMILSGRNKIETPE